MNGNNTDDIVTIEEFGTYLESTILHRQNSHILGVRTRKVVGEMIVLWASCGYLRGDRVLSSGSGGRQPKGMQTSTYARLEFFQRGTWWAHSAGLHLHITRILLITTSNPKYVQLFADEYIATIHFINL